MSRLSAIGWCLLLGCSSPPATCVELATTTVADPGGVEHVPLELVFPMTFAHVNECKVPDVTVTLEVLDPLNDPVPSALTPFPPLGFKATFTPPMAGSYHLVASFGPGLRTRQADILVAADRTDAGEHAIAAPVGCRVFSVAGTQPLCSNGAVVVALAPDGGGEQVDGGVFAVDDSQRVWVGERVGGSSFLRAYAVDGGHFYPLGSGGADEPIVSLVARGGRAAVVTTAAAQVWQLEDDGGITEPGYISLGGLQTQSDAGQWCISFSPPLHLALTTPERVPPVCWSDGSVFTHCLPQFASVEIGGADEHGLWWGTGTQLVANSADTLGDGGFTSGFTTLVFQPPDCSPSEASPMTSLNQLIARLDGTQIGLEKFPALAGPQAHATSRIVWVRVDGGYVWWDR